MKQPLPLTCLCLALIAPLAHATPTSAPIRTEIDGLLNRLQSSGCEFNRNGTWYSGSEAKTHLLRKLAYLEDKGTLRNAEQFIELAATSSSFSGSAYQVRCGATPPVPSRQWLTRELSALRGSSAKKP